LNQPQTITLSALFQNKQILNNKNGLNSIYDISATLAIRLLHPRRQTIFRRMRVNKGHFSFTQINYHSSRMPVFDGFSFSSEEPHNNFTLSQETSR
jgi:hypothetical protein